jgi:cytidylate kinase
MKEIVTIDGPAGAGKSHISREVASRLGYTYLDTGAMYRAAGLFARQNMVPVDDEKMVAEILPQMEMEFRDGRILLNGRDVSGLIRTPEIDTLSSAISRLPCVRARLTELQRQMGKAGGIVAEGRDMGTVVFPDARHKFFLTATPEERARRRALQMREQGKRGDDIDYHSILAAINARDAADSNRETAPMRKADDALEIDSTNLEPEEVIRIILDKVVS